MNETLHKALLPEGLRDLLPPDAGIEADVVSRLMAVLASHGYERVKPPLAEFENNLLSGAGAAMAKDTFRVMDPVSQRMIGLRADMTPQVARIAATRLKKAPRPLRLCYAGQVLRVKGSQLRPSRQVGQVGAELIGPADVAADAEAISLAAEALAGLDLQGISVDLTLPTLVPAICRAAKLDPAQGDAVRRALDHKDAAALRKAAGPVATVLGELLKAAGTAEKSLAKLAALDLPKSAADERARLGDVIGRVKQAAPALVITVDPVENRGFEYHTGVSFTFFAKAVRGELGRGGRYRTDNGGGEDATGFTLYADTILQALPEPPAPRRIYVPFDGDLGSARRLRTEGWITVAGLAPVRNARDEAKRLNCGHLLDGGKIIVLT
ncbi:MAG: ATP phosphoribosyltransferase regulatory subunit [Alphaproteobacteria bacterium]|nr:ATP phosphoribosyltransferase regulatory subunit [Alphaproteobacteria bacterium]